MRVSLPSSPSLRRCESSPSLTLLTGAITHDNTATMSWSRRSYMKNVVTRYRVRIEGWPLSEVPFRNLSDVPNLGKLELLLQGWKEGSIRFCQITEEQYLAMIHDPTPWIGPAIDDAEGEE